MISTGLYSPALNILLYSKGSSWILIKLNCSYVATLTWLSLLWTVSAHAAGCYPLGSPMSTHVPGPKVTLLSTGPQPIPVLSLLFYWDARGKRTRKQLTHFIKEEVKNHITDTKLPSAKPVGACPKSQQPEHEESFQHIAQPAGTGSPPADIWLSLVTPFLVIRMNKLRTPIGAMEYEAWKSIISVDWQERLLKIKCLYHFY